MKVVGLWPATWSVPTWRNVEFSINQARRALPFVERVVVDVSTAYRKARACRLMLEQPRTKSERRQLSATRDRALMKLNRGIDEFQKIGADLIDLDRGIVSFPTRISTREVCLLWCLNEPTDDAWPMFSDED